MGKGFGNGGGAVVGMLNVLAVLATYASEMIVFATIIACLLERKKKTA